MNQEIQPHKEAYKKLLGKHLGDLFAVFIDRFADMISFLSPNTISFVSFCCAIIAAVFIYLNNIFLLYGSLFILLSMTFDLLDGVVARKRGLVSKQGGFLEIMLDRCADISLFWGISVSPRQNLYLGLSALVANLFLAYVRLYKYAISSDKKYSYSIIFGRAMLLITLSLGCFVQYFLNRFGLDSLSIFIFRVNFLDLIMLVIAALSIIAATLLFKNIWVSLGEDN